MIPTLQHACSAHGYECLPKNPNIWSTNPTPLKQGLRFVCWLAGGESLGSKVVLTPHHEPPKIWHSCLSWATGGSLHKHPLERFGKASCALPCWCEKLTCSRRHLWFARRGSSTNAFRRRSARNPGRPGLDWMVGAVAFGDYGTEWVFLVMIGFSKLINEN